MKLTASVRRKITHDWATAFPLFAVYKPMWLLRRKGPLLLGVLLERDSGNATYRPTFHVHNLAKPSPIVSLTMAQPLVTTITKAPETIVVSNHESVFQSAATRLAEQALIPISRDVILTEILNGYFAAMKTPVEKYPLTLYEDVVLLQAISGKTQSARASLMEYIGRVKSWPRQVGPEDGVEKWAAELSRCVNNPNGLADIVEGEVCKHGLSMIPDVPLVS